MRKVACGALDLALDLPVLRVLGVVLAVLRVRVGGGAARARVLVLPPRGGAGEQRQEGGGAQHPDGAEQLRSEEELLR